MKKILFALLFILLFNLFLSSNSYAACIGPGSNCNNNPVCCTPNYSCQPGFGGSYCQPNPGGCVYSGTCDSNATKPCCAPNYTCSPVTRTCLQTSGCVNSGISCDHTIPNPCCNPNDSCNYLGSLGGYTCTTSGGGGNSSGPGPGPGLGAGSYGGGLSLQSIGNFFNNSIGGVPTGGYSAIQTAAAAFYSLLVILAVILTLFFLIWGGFDWMTSGGDKQKLHSARQKLTFAIIGLVIVILSFFIINFFYSFFGNGTVG